ncbi:hypothetical protein ACI8AC_23690 [Geodermatophilus sp. SYSU D00758]
MLQTEASDAVGNGLLLGLAALAIGGFLGFLFALANTREAPDGRDGMQQIADWIIKLVLGAGLVGFVDGVNALMAAADQFGYALNPDNRDAGKFTAVFTALFYWAVGILLGYWLTSNKTVFVGVSTPEVASVSTPAGGAATD